MFLIEKAKKLSQTHLMIEGHTDELTRRDLFRAVENSKRIGCTAFTLDFNSVTFTTVALYPYFLFSVFDGGHFKFSGDPSNTNLEKAVRSSIDEIKKRRDLR